MSVGTGIKQVIDGHNFQTVAMILPNGFEHLTTNTPKAVNTYT
jgi:hypothetical protein